MKLKKTIAGLALIGGFLALASCGSSEPAKTSTAQESTSQAETTSATERDALKLDFLADGKARIDVYTPGLTIKINGTAVTSGAQVDIGNFAITYEGTLTAEVFYVYWAAVQSNGEHIQVYPAIETEQISAFFTSILSTQHTSSDKRIYLCITTTKRGWTHNLDTRMDATFEAMTSDPIPQV